MTLLQGDFDILLDGAWMKECAADVEVAREKEGARHRRSPITQLNCAALLLGAPGARPIQFSVLAAPVTSGRRSVGYTLADAVALPPPRAADGFVERLVLLPMGGYPFAHATWAPRSPSAVPSSTRGAQRLPSSAFVFASFVQRWKLNPITFPVWLNVLRRTPHSVIWVLQHSLDGAAGHLSAMLQLEMGDVHARRLHVMRRLPLEAHVARTGLGDLTLDTHPYSAHTTAADSLWLNGPPWLALATGERFDSRLSTAVLAAIGMQESAGRTLRMFEDLGAQLGASALPRAQPLRTG